MGSSNEESIKGWFAGRVAEAWFTVVYRVGGIDAGAVQPDQPGGVEAQYPADPGVGSYRASSGHHSLRWSGLLTTSKTISGDAST